MKYTYRLVLPGALVLLGLSLVLLSGCSSREDTGIGGRFPFPDRTTETAFIQKDGDSSITRIVKFAGDGITPVEERLIYPDASERTVFYRPDFTVWRILDYYPPEEGNTEGRLKSEALLGSDGKSFICHTVYSPDGHRTKEGRRLADSSGYQTETYAASGIVLQRQLYSLSGDLLKLETFREDGTPILSKRTFKKSYSTMITESTYFDDSGSVSHRVTESDSAYEDTKIEVYYPGTSKIRLLYQPDKGHIGGTVEVYSPNGEKIKKWDISDSQVVLEVFAVGSSSSESRLYRQVWTRTDKTATVGSKVINFQLESLEEFDYTEAEQSSYKSRLIVFGGKDLPTQLVFGNGYQYSSNKPVQYLDQYGQVIKKGYKRSYGSDDLTDVEKPFDIAKPVDPARLIFESPELLPLVDYPEVSTRAVKFEWLPKPPPPPEPEPMPEPTPDPDKVTDDGKGSGDENGTDAGGDPSSPADATKPADTNGGTGSTGPVTKPQEPAVDKPLEPTKDADKNVP